MSNPKIEFNYALQITKKSLTIFPTDCNLLKLN